MSPKFIEARAKSRIELVEVIHRQGNAWTWIVVHFSFDDRAIVALEPDDEAAFAGNLEIGRAILVAESVAADDDRPRPAGHETRNILAYR